MANKYPAPFEQRRKDLAMIHMMATQLGMDVKDQNESSEYRSVLWAVARVRSAAELDWRGRKMVREHLDGLLKARGIDVVAGKNAGKPANVKPELIPLMGKIGALLADQKLPWKYLTSSKSGPCMLKRLAGVERLEWADAAGLRAIVAALEKRAAKLRENPPLPPRKLSPFAKGGGAKRGGISGDEAP